MTCIRTQQIHRTEHQLIFAVVQCLDPLDPLDQLVLDILPDIGFGRRFAVYSIQWEARLTVTVPIMPIPVIIRNTAIIRPPIDTGEISPFPQDDDTGKARYAQQRRGTDELPHQRGSADEREQLREPQQPDQPEGRIQGQKRICSVGVSRTIP
jgi:hypothetical protein